MKDKATVKSYNYIKQFRCLGDKCEDTCCSGWGMQVDKEHKEKYEKEAPELLDAVTSGEAEYIMRRDPETDFCVKFNAGLCSIHSHYGESFLGDACHFFPRISRQFDDTVTMAAALSCPEIVRLSVMGGQDAFELTDMTFDRLPNLLKEYLPEELSAKDALAVTQAFIEAGNADTIAAEDYMAHIVTVAQSLENIQTSDWPNAIHFLLKTAHSRLPEADIEIADPYRVLHALSGIISAAPNAKRPRLMETFSAIETALEAHIDWDSMQISSTAPTLSAYLNMMDNCPLETLIIINRVLIRWIQTQLSIVSFPFAGLGNTLSERVTILALRFATLRLALLSHAHTHNGILEEDDLTRIIQSLARLLDHLSDPTLSLAIYKDAGWLQSSRLHGLLTYAPKLSNLSKKENNHFLAPA